MTPHPNRRLLGAIAAAGTLLAVADPAAADVGMGNRIGIDFGPAPVLARTLHGRVSSESGTVAYTATGTFKIGRVPIARLAAFSGTATTTPTAFSVHVSAATIRRLRAAGRRHHAMRTTLTLTEHLEGSATVWHEDKYLRLHG